MAEIVAKYMEFRKNGETSEVIKLVSDDIYFYNVRDGEYHGREAFERYLLIIPYTGTWNQPDPATITDGTTVVRVTGIIRAYFMNWHVEALFTLNNDGLIRQIIVRNT